MSTLHLPPSISSTARVPRIISMSLVLDASQVADLESGKIDPRIVDILDEVSQRHRITVSALMSDHAVHTAGGSVSTHAYGRAVDIAAVDGQPVSPGNATARKLAESLLRLPSSIRPTELGSPWDLR